MIIIVYKGGRKSGSERFITEPRAADSYPPLSFLVWRGKKQVQLPRNKNVSEGRARRRHWIQSRSMSLITLSNCNKTAAFGAGDETPASNKSGYQRVTHSLSLSISPHSFIPPAQTPFEFLQLLFLSSATSYPEYSVWVDRIDLCLSRLYNNYFVLLRYLCK